MKVSNQFPIPVLCCSLKIHIHVHWFTVSCSWMDGYQRFGRICYLNFPASIEVIGSFETLIPIYQTTRRHIPDNRKPDTQRYEAQVSYVLFCITRYFLGVYVA
jgi:hypothetical protein